MGMRAGMKNASTRSCDMRYEEESKASTELCTFESAVASHLGLEQLHEPALVAGLHARKDRHDGHRLALLDRCQLIKLQPSQHLVDT